MVRGDLAREVAVEEIDAWLKSVALAIRVISEAMAWYSESIIRRWVGVVGARGRLFGQFLHADQFFVDDLTARRPPSG